jgi:hypothetical protein
MAAGFLPAQNDPAPEPRNGAPGFYLVQFDAVEGNRIVFNTSWHKPTGLAANPHV